MLSILFAIAESTAAEGWVAASDEQLGLSRTTHRRTLRVAGSTNELELACTSGQVHPHEPLGVRFVLDEPLHPSPAMELRFDDVPPIVVTGRRVEATAEVELDPDDSVDLMERLVNSKRLTVRYGSVGQPVELTFDLEGAAEAVQALQDACHRPRVGRSPEDAGELAVRPPIEPSTSARIIHKEAPLYPDGESAGYGIDHRCRADLTIDERTGVPIDLVVTGMPGEGFGRCLPRFHDALRLALLQWRWEPVPDAEAGDQVTTAICVVFRGR